jgi:glycosyltransferase involved in cell wall biosynthesis
MADSVLLVHNRYLERGGEDSAFEIEGRLLEQFGHRVVRYERDNRAIAELGSARAAARTLWSRTDHEAIGRLVRDEAIEVVHFHNTFPLISPAAYYAARGAGAAVVQTLHNFRLLCPGGLLLRDGKPCESCVGRSVAWPAVVHRCYRDSAAATGILTSMLTLHRVLGTWSRQVDAFIALSRFARERFVAGGLPAERIFVKGGVVDGAGRDPVRDATSSEGVTGTHFLYVGRLSAEKGIHVLLDAWRRLPAGVSLRIVGDGPLRDAVAAAAALDQRIEWLGMLSAADVMREMGAAWALVFPSLCYENAPGVLAEAQSAALPVIASDLGSGAEIVADGGFGVRFHSGDAGALAAAIISMHGAAELRAELAKKAILSYHTRLAPAECYGRLAEIYGHALRRRRAAATLTAQAAGLNPTTNHE